MREEPILYIIVPAYNEEEGIVHSAQVLKEKLKRLCREGKAKAGSRILFVNDGSRDETGRLLNELCREDAVFGVLHFSRNFGHQAAILAGMTAAAPHADAVVTIDADLQQDVEALDEFLLRYREGCDVVYGVRKNRKTDGLLKKTTAGLFYRFMRLMGCDVLPNHADYRLLSRAALNALSQFKEVNLFIRGMVPLLGFRSEVVYFDVKEREAGESKYTLSKMGKLAVDGITSLSIRPIRMITVLGFALCLVSLGMILYVWRDWVRGNNVPGYTTNLISVWVLGGLILFSLGILGEYVGKIYLETKNRPRYILESMILRPEKEEERSAEKEESRSREAETELWETETELRETEG